MIKRIKNRVFSQNRRLNKLSKMERYQNGKINLDGLEFYYTDACTMHGGYEEIFYNNAYKFYSENPAPKIIDCGANIGLSVLYFKKVFPHSHVTAFEADPNIFHYLKENIKVNHIDNVDTVNAAVWINNEGVNFRKEGGFSGRIPKEGDKDVIQINSIRLKDYLNESVALLKLDIEGAEYEVIKDCATSFDKVENLFVEYHSHVHEEQNLHELLAILHNVGFRYHIKNAFVREAPFIDTNNIDGMDLQLNIYCLRNK